jgi:diguanylate cyclase (GGDEF)-like protein/PAS domain S-box-containing protein
LVHAAATVPWYRSIRLRLVVTAVLVEAVMLTILLANSYRLVSDALESQTRNRLAALAPLLDAALAGRVFQRDHSEITAISKQLVSSKYTEISYIIVLDQRGDLLASIGKVTPQLLSGKAPEDRSVVAALTDLTYDTSVQLTVQGKAVGSARFGLSLADLIALRGAVLDQSILIALGEIVLSLLLLASGGYLITRHISSLVSATRRIASADYSTPITIASRDEIGLLADNFNAMAATVQSRIAQLAESEGRFRSIFDAAGDAFFIYDAESGQLLDVNRRMCEMYGCTREQALMLSLADLSANVAPYTPVEAAEKLRLVRDGPQTFDWLARRLDGQLFWVEVNLRSARIGIAHRIIALVRDISERKQQQSYLEHIAHHDTLTSLPNRVLLADRLNQSMAQAQRRGQLLAVAYLDLDGFKAINDRHGHDAGDQLLIVLATRMKQALREGDTLARLGGDEFVTVLIDLDNEAAGVPMLTRLLAAVSQPVPVGDLMLQVSASIGVSFYPQEAVDADQLLRQADQAMYQAKLAGKNRYHVFDAKQDSHIRGHHESLERIRRALTQGEFVLHYQPKVNMRTGAVIGAEALIRWQCPERGLLPPAEFLPVIEDHPLAIEVGEWVINTALTQIALWYGQGLDIPVSVNVGARQMQQANFVESLRAIMAAHPDVRPDRLEIEVLETSALEDLAHVSQVMDACRMIGINFALDDFGTGYSSLTYLKRLPVSMLKIDQSFVRDMLDDPDDLSILDGVLGLAAAFNRQAIAEGVETLEHGAMLLQLGCELAQGYGIARPMPADIFPAWAAAWRVDPSWCNLPVVSRADLPLLYASVDHRVWITAIEDFLRGQRDTPPPLDVSQCRFGKWLDVESRANHSSQPVFQAIEQIHQQVHALAAMLVDLQSQGRTPEALARLDELFGLRESLLGHLQVLIRWSSPRA